MRKEISIFPFFWKTRRPNGWRNDNFDFSCFQGVKNVRDAVNEFTTRNGGWVKSWRKLVGRIVKLVIVSSPRSPNFSTRNVIEKEAFCVDLKKKKNDGRVKISSHSRVSSEKRIRDENERSWEPQKPPNRHIKTLFSLSHERYEKSMQLCPIRTKRISHFPSPCSAQQDRFVVFVRTVCQQQIHRETKWSLACLDECVECWKSMEAKKGKKKWKKYWIG